MTRINLSLLAVAVAACFCILLWTRSAPEQSQVLFDEADSERKVRNRVQGSEFNHDQNSHYTVWHRAHSPSFSVMHVVEPKSGERDRQSGGMGSLMRHAENMLQKDNMQLAQENKQFAESKPKGLYNKIRHSDERPEKYEEEAVDHQIDSQYKSKEAQRESLKSELERRR
ncbi:hypothetical protein GUITHDRAFT_161639, partial [Guillardia theta CCMP2712]